MMAYAWPTLRSLFQSTCYAVTFPRLIFVICADTPSVHSALWPIKLDAAGSSLAGESGVAEAAELGVAVELVLAWVDAVAGDEMAGDSSVGGWAVQLQVAISKATAVAKVDDRSCLPRLGGAAGWCSGGIVAFGTTLGSDSMR